ARFAIRLSCRGSTGASVATTRMIEPWATQLGFGAEIIAPTFTPLIRNSSRTPLLLCTSTPTVYRWPAISAIRHHVPIPELHSNDVVPVPPPTDPSATGPPLAPFQ